MGSPPNLRHWVVAGRGSAREIGRCRRQKRANLQSMVMLCASPADGRQVPGNVISVAPGKGTFAVSFVRLRLRRGRKEGEAEETEVGRWITG